jgi:hypothetical protein
MKNTYMAAAYEVEVGDVVLESDGFMWNVEGRSFNNGRYTFVLSPRFQSITARGSRTVTVKRSASIRIERTEAA